MVPTFFLGGGGCPKRIQQIQTEEERDLKLGFKKKNEGNNTMKLKGEEK